MAVEVQDFRALAIAEATSHNGTIGACGVRFICLAASYNELPVSFGGRVAFEAADRRRCANCIKRLLPCELRGARVALDVTRSMQRCWRPALRSRR